jgi:hypothetical protein
MAIASSKLQLYIPGLRPFEGIYKELHRGPPYNGVVSKIKEANIAKAIAHSLQDKQEGKFGDQAHLITTIAEVNIARAVRNSSLHHTQQEVKDSSSLTLPRLHRRLRLIHRRYRNQSN